MSEQTKAALEDALRAHVADEGGGTVTAWILSAGIYCDDADYFFDGPTDQPGYITVGLAHMAVDHVTGTGPVDEGTD